jgi:plasmid replication initiation protein
MAKKKIKNSLKISNDFVNSIITKNNHLTLKILFYVVQNGTIIEQNSQITTITLNLKTLKTNLDLDFKNLRQNLKQIQKTLITIQDKKNIIDITLIPKVVYNYYEQTIELNLFNEVLNELKELKNKFTTIDLDNLINLQNKHSIRLLTILENINGYDDNFGKVKYFSKDELNTLFNTNYKGVKEIERAILKPIQDELDQYSKLSFIYNLEYDIDTMKIGRKPIVGVKIYIKENKHRQLKLF